MKTSAMARIWATRLKAETQQFENCPSKYRDDVIVILKDAVASGDITSEKYEKITQMRYSA